MSDLTPEVLDELELVSNLTCGCIYCDIRRSKVFRDTAQALIAAARERDRLRAALAEARQFIATGVEFGYITVLCDEIDRLRKEVMRLKAITSPESAG